MATPTRGPCSRPLNTPYGRFCMGNGWSTGIGKKQGTEKSHAKTQRRKGKAEGIFTTETQRTRSLEDKDFYRRPIGKLQRDARTDRSLPDPPTFVLSVSLW